MRFHYIDTTNASTLNRLLGPAPFTTSNWPKHNGAYMHHVLTFDASKSAHPRRDEARTISLFCGSQGELELRLSSSEAFVYPEAYKGWWDGVDFDPEMVTRWDEGVGFSFDVLEAVSEDEFPL